MELNLCPADEADYVEAFIQNLKHDIRLRLEHSIEDNTGISVVKEVLESTIMSCSDELPAAEDVADVQGDELVVQIEAESRKMVSPVAVCSVLDEFPKSASTAKTIYQSIEDDGKLTHPMFSIVGKLVEQNGACEVFAEMTEPTLEKDLRGIKVTKAAHSLLDERHMLSPVDSDLIFVGHFAECNGNDDSTPLIERLPLIFYPGTSIVNRDLGAADMLNMPLPSFWTNNELIQPSIVQTEVEFPLLKAGVQLVKAGVLIPSKQNDEEVINQLLDIMPKPSSIQPECMSIGHNLFNEMLDRYLIKQIDKTHGREEVVPGVMALSIIVGYKMNGSETSKFTFDPGGSTSHHVECNAFKSNKYSVFPNVCKTNFEGSNIHTVPSSYSSQPDNESVSEWEAISSNSQFQLVPLSEFVEIRIDCKLNTKNGIYSAIGNTGRPMKYKALAYSEKPTFNGWTIYNIHENHLGPGKQLMENFHMGMLAGSCHFPEGIFLGGYKNVVLLMIITLQSFVWDPGLGAIFPLSHAHLGHFWPTWWVFCFLYILGDKDDFEGRERGWFGKRKKFRKEMSHGMHW